MSIVEEAAPLFHEFITIPDGSTMVEEIQHWKTVAAVVQEALRQIDPLLSQENVPISARKLKAFDILQNTILEVPDYGKFWRSTAYGRFLVVIDDWYRDRYGNGAVQNDEDKVFVSAVFVHGTPFAMSVPRVFLTPGDEPNTVWVGFPASVQAEEDPLTWIQNRDVVSRLSDDELSVVEKAALETADLIRSIGFDVRPLEHDENLNIAELAGSVRSDLQSSARNLCQRNEASLRSSAWDASQATEKALKLLIRQKGHTPPSIHDLSDLATRAKSLGAKTIDRGKLRIVPSGKCATDIRYEGDMTLSQAASVYRAALSIIRQVVFEAGRDIKLDFREGRILMRRPPYFDFDTDEFSKQLRC